MLPEGRTQPSGGSWRIKVKTGRTAWLMEMEEETLEGSRTNDACEKKDCARGRRFSLGVRRARLEGENKGHAVVGG